MYVYCVYPLFSKIAKQMANCPKRSETSDVLVAFYGALYDVRAHTVTFLNMKQVPEKLYLGQ